MPRNVSVINETQTTVSLTASLPRHHNLADSLPVTSWRIQYERDSTDSDTQDRIFNTSTYIWFYFYLLTHKSQYKHCACAVQRMHDVSGRNVLPLKNVKSTNFRAFKGFC